MSQSVLRNQLRARRDSQICLQEVNNVIQSRGITRGSLGMRTQNIMTTLVVVPVFAAAGYSLMYLLGGGGLVGALVIFVVAKMFGK